MPLTVNTILAANITGTVATAITKTSVTTQGSVLINPVSGSLNLDRLFVVIENTLTVATSVVIEAGTTYSSVGQGDSATIAIGTVASATAFVTISGAHLESARYLTDSGQLLLSIPSAATVNLYAVQYN